MIDLNKIREAQRYAMDTDRPACGRRIARGLLEEIAAMGDRLRLAKLDLEKERAKRRVRK